MQSCPSRLSKRFLPVFLKYGTSRGDGGDSITVEFKDYRKLDQGWYPFEIIYQEEQGCRERHIIDQVQVNVAIESTLFDGAKEGSPKVSPRFTDEDERLKQIIEGMEKRYGN